MTRRVAWRPPGLGVSDELRKVMAVPSLSEAKAREADFNAK
jgi:hypothetical protein